VAGLVRYGKTDNGVVTVTTVWADERLYYPVHAVPPTPRRHFAKGKGDPGFRTKLAIGADLAVRARDAGFVFRAVTADSAHGDQARSDAAIRRHQVLVNCAFSFCWDAWFTEPTPLPRRRQATMAERGGPEPPGPSAQPRPGPGGARAWLTPLDHATALVGRLVERAPARTDPGADDIRPSRPRPAPLHPNLTNYR
jgi:hypothetical protein